MQWTWELRLRTSVGIPGLKWISRRMATDVKGNERCTGKALGTGVAWWPWEAGGIVLFSNPFCEKVSSPVWVRKTWKDDKRWNSRQPYFINYFIGWEEATHLGKMTSTSNSMATPTALIAIALCNGMWRQDADGVFGGEHLDSPQRLCKPDSRERCPAEAGPVRKAVSLGWERHLEVRSGKIGAAWCEICCSFISYHILVCLILMMLCDAEWKGLRKVLDMVILIFSPVWARMIDVFCFYAWLFSIANESSRKEKPHWKLQWLTMAPRWSCKNLGEWTASWTPRYALNWIIGNAAFDIIRQALIEACPQNHFGNCKRMRHVSITGLQQICNTTIWKAYEFRRDQVRKDLEGRQGVPTVWAISHPVCAAGRTWNAKINEILVIHGTTEDKTKEIANFGFDGRLASERGLYGQGVISQIRVARVCNIRERATTMTPAASSLLAWS